MKITVTDLRGHGVTVHGRPVVGIDIELTNAFAASGARTVEDLARDAQKLADNALDAADTDGTDPGTTFFAIGSFVDPGGIRRVHATFEHVDAVGGFVAHVPEILDE